MITFFVAGTPKPQGSKKGFNNPKTGRVILVESAGPALKLWRRQVKTAAKEQGKQITGPVKVQLRFVMRRPKAHYGTGRNAELLKPAAPVMCDKTPDLDKLTRAVLDGLANAVIEDDSRVVWLEAWKKYADPNENTGCDIFIREHK